MKKVGLLITDTHLKESNIDDNVNIYNQCIAYCDQYDIDIIYHGGDVFNSRKAQTLKVLNAFTDILDTLHKNNITLIAIPGNHDKFDYESEESFLDPFKHHPALTLFSIGGGVSVSRDLDIRMIPFFNEKTTYKKYFDECLLTPFSAKKTILITHIAIDGVVNNDGSEISESFSRSSFDMFDYIYVGHYHNRQDLNDKIKYIGSSLPHNFGDNQDKGIYAINNDGTVIQLKTQFKQYINIKVNTQEELQQALIDAEEDLNSAVKIVFTGTSQDAIKIDKSQFKNFTNVTFQCKPKDEVQIEADVEVKELSIDNNELMQLFSEFCIDNELDDPDYYKNQLNSYLND